MYQLESDIDLLNTSDIGDSTSTDAVEAAPAGATVE
jgi:hypothetical protein